MTISTHLILHRLAQFLIHIAKSNSNALDIIPDVSIEIMYGDPTIFKYCMKNDFLYRTPTPQRKVSKVIQKCVEERIYFTSGVIS
jgi:hypothetical protein